MMTPGKQDELSRQLASLDWSELRNAYDSIANPYRGEPTSSNAIAGATSQTSEKAALARMDDTSIPDVGGRGNPRHSRKLDHGPAQAPIDNVATLIAAVVGIVAVATAIARTAI